MYLEKLTINSSKGVIREVPFKEGLNLIVDETTGISTDSGNNIGKTTFLRIIDYCLGGNKNSIYTDKEFNRKNEKVFNFLKKENVFFNLEIKTLQGLTHSISRPIEGKSSIDGDIINSDTKFKEAIKNLLFNFTDSRPTLNQLMNRFIRIEQYQHDNALFFLHDTNDHSEYEALFMFLFGYKDTKTLSIKRGYVDRVKKLNRQLKSKDIIHSIDDLEQQINLIQKDILELEEIKSNFDFEKSVDIELASLKKLQASISDLKQKISKLNIKISLSNHTLAQLKESKTTINVNVLKTLYKNAELEIGKLDKKFVEVLNFHNSMINNKMSYIENNISIIQENINNLKNELSRKLNEESSLLRIISTKGALGDYDNINLKLQDKNRERGHKEGLIEHIRSIKSETEKELQKLNETNQEIDKFISSYKKNLMEFNIYFSDYSKKLYGEEYYLTTKKVNNNTTDNYILDIGNMNENMGAGKKKAQISALDIAYLKYSEVKDLKVPRFVLHDQLETVFENQIDTLFDLADNIDAQFIVAVLSDKLKKISKQKIKDYTILTLSQDDKLLKLK